MLSLKDILSKPAENISFDDSNTNIKSDNIQNFCEGVDNELLNKLENSNSIVKDNITVSGTNPELILLDTNYIGNGSSYKLSTNDGSLSILREDNLGNWQQDILLSSDGKITFTKLPQSSEDPNLSSELSNKGYVDSSIGNLANHVYFKSEFITTSSGSGDAGKPIILNNNGLVDPSLFDSSAFEYIGTWDPSGGTEYPDATGHDSGAFWIIQGVTGDYTFTGGDLSGVTVDDGDMLVWNGSNWTHVNSNVDPNVYYKLDGSQAITADFQAGGHKLTNVGAAVNGGDVPRWDQVVPKSGGKFDGSVTVSGNLTAYNTLVLKRDDVQYVPRADMYLSTQDAVRLAVVPASGTPFNVWGYEHSTDVFAIYRKPTTAFSFTPTGNNDLTSKKYVDDSIKDYVDYDTVYLPQNPNGCLITTDWNKANSIMFRLEIRGNSYTGGENVHCDIEGYWYSNDHFSNLHGIQLGEKFNVTAMMYNDKLAFWINCTNWNWPSINVKLIDTRYGSKVDATLADSAKPTSNVTYETNIEPDYYSPSTGNNHNYLINGNFDIWQRGTSFSVTNNHVYSADRWVFGDGSTGSKTVTRQEFTPGQTDVPGEPKYYLRFAVDSNTQDGANLDQKIEDVRTLAGQVCTLSFWAKSDSPTTVNTQFIQVFGINGSSYVTTSPIAYDINTSWQYYTFTVNIPSVSGKTIGNGSHLTCRVVAIGSNSGAVTIDIARVQVEKGPNATEFEIRDLSTELSMCQRYFEKSYNIDIEPGTVGTGNGYVGITVYNSQDYAILPVRFKVDKRTNPTVILYSGSSGNSGYVYRSTNGDTTAIPHNVGTSGMDGVHSFGSNATAGETVYFHYTADAEL